MLYKNSFLLYGKIYITTAQFTTAVHVQLSLKKTSANESAPSIISPNSVIVKFSRLPFRYSQPDSRRPLPWIFHLHPSSKVVLLFFILQLLILRSTTLAYTLCFCFFYSAVIIFYVLLPCAGGTYFCRLRQK